MAKAEHKALDTSVTTAETSKVDTSEMVKEDAPQVTTEETPVVPDMQTLDEILAPPTWKVHSETGLNLRVGPGRQFDAIAVLPDGLTLTELPLPDYICFPGWMCVQCDLPLMDGAHGWVCIDYIEEP